MYEFWCDNVKPKHGEKLNLCYMDTDRILSLHKSRRHVTSALQKMFKLDLMLQIMD